MALKAFRRIDLMIDRANDYIIEAMLDAHEGDYNGRNLRVQITNAGIITDTTGIVLNFGFKRIDNGAEGVYPFSAVNLSEGVYEAAYPREMLEGGKGYAICVIQIIDGDTITNTKNFSVYIEESLIDQDTVVAENSPNVMQKALIDINNLNNEIVIVEATLAELIAQYNDLDNQIRNTIATREQMQQVATKVDDIILDLSKVSAMHDRILSQNTIKGFSTTNLPNSETTVLSVTGSGFLHEFISYVSSLKSVTIKILIDNTVILNTKITSVGTKGSYTYMQPVDRMVAQDFPLGLKYNHLISFGPNYIARQGESGNINYFWAITATPVKFNSSLVIKLSADEDSSGRFGAFYEVV